MAFLSEPVNILPRSLCQEKSALMKIFIHGLESSNQGTKAVYFKGHFPDMVIPHFTGELSERMDKLKGILQGKSGILIVGSSFGGLMASLFAMDDETRVDRLILLAPAINYIDSSGFRAKRISTPVRIYHGTKDDVIPLNAAEDAAEKYFSNLLFNRVDDDHFLHRTFETIDWAMLLEGGEGKTGCLNRE
jgi:pimeloyl-ACP methyl ester carboxylesterase